MLKMIAGAMIVALIGVAVFVGWSLLRFGSTAFGWAYCNGYSLYPDAASVSGGQVEAGREVVVPFELRNLGGTPVSVVGARSDCGCATVDDLPLQVAPGGKCQLRVRFRTARTEAGRTAKHMTLLYLDVNNPPIVLTATADVRR